MIEHDTIRARGAYDDPRIHFAVNCASIGCPMLREEAYVAERLDRQLEEQVARFLSDRSRNRYNPRRRRARSVGDLPLVRGGFHERAARAYQSREQFFAQYAALLADSPGAPEAHPRAEGGDPLPGL